MQLSLRRIFKYLSISLASLIMLLAIAVGLIPSALKWGIHSWFERYQLNSAVEDIELQLFDGRLAIRNLSVSKGHQQKFKLTSVIIKLDPQAILKRQIVIQQFILRGFDLSVEQKQDKTLLLAGVTLPVSNPTAESPVTQTSSPWSLTIKDIDLAGLRACYQSLIDETHELCASLKRLKWQGETRLDLYSTTSELTRSLQTESSLNLRILELKDITNKVTLASIDRIDINNIHMQGLSTTNIDSIELSSIAALESPVIDTKPEIDPVLRAKSIRAHDITISNTDKISISTLTGYGVNLILQREATGKLQVTKSLANYKSLFRHTTASEKNNISAEKTTLNLKLNQLELLDHSSLHFTDKAEKTNSRLELNDIQLSLQDINSEKRQARSPIKIDLRLGQHGKLHQQGNIMLFASRPTLKLDGHLRGINVTDFNAYIQNSIQHYVKSGHLDAETSINIDQGNLDSSTQLKLYKFYVEAVTGQASQQYQEQVGLPLGTALSLLRDRDDSITLKLPVTGDITAPDFSLNDVINKVSSKALKTAVINYYSPLGILSLASGLFDLATALRFEPLIFDISTAMLDQADTIQLDNLALVLKERPQLHLVICGISTQADRLAWFPDDFESSINDEGDTISTLPTLNQKQLERLDQLAHKRSTVIEQYLINVHNIDANRLILCTPKHQAGDTQPSRAELQI